MADRSVRSALVAQTAVCSAMARASSISMPRYLTITLLWPSRDLNGTQIAGPLVDHPGFGPTQRMGAVNRRIKTDTAKPVAQEACILARGKRGGVMHAAREQIRAGFGWKCP